MILSENRLPLFGIMPDGSKFTPRPDEVGEAARYLPQVRSFLMCFQTAGSLSGKLDTVKPPPA
jgi:hypothetical protein